MNSAMLILFFFGNSQVYADLAWAPVVLMIAGRRRAVVVSGFTP